jgi:transcriptional regulator with XRE-family HTH domain
VSDEPRGPENDGGARRRATLAEQFGETVRDLRHQRGFSQRSLAALARLHRTEIHMLEHGRREPRLLTIVTVADALGVDPSFLVVGLRPPRARLLRPVP